jgi:hypothetical protein
MASPGSQATDESELQLPDLDVMVRGCQAIANELPKFRNIPAFDVGAAILTEMRAMREEMREMRLETRRNNNRLDSRFKAMYVTLPSFLPLTTNFTATAGARENCSNESLIITGKSTMWRV